MPVKRTYIIAEAGVNHNGSLDLAKKLVAAAADAGADAVKFQTFKAENLVSINAQQAEYQIANTGKKETQFAMLKSLELKHEHHFEIEQYCKKKEITFLSTPFDSESLAFLIENFDMPFIKIGSGEVTNAPFLLEIAQTGKPVVLSTGMSNLEEVREALSVLAFGYTQSNMRPSIEAFKAAFNSSVGKNALKELTSLLHCTTEYPCPYEDVNLNAMATMEKAFGLPVGYSDHTAGIEVSLAATALGAKIIEKHFTLDKTMDGPDHKASLEPKELKDMVNEIRLIDEMDESKKRIYLEQIEEVKILRGNGIKVPSLSELKNIPIARKSIVASCDIRAGEPFSEKNLCIKRPGNGKSPIALWELYDKPASKNFGIEEVIL